MRTWQKALLTVATVGLATWVLLATRGDNEPSYEGKPLHYWVNCFSAPTQTYKPTSQEPKATEAIRHMGTNAFPILLQWLCYDNTIPRNQFWRRLPLWLRKIKPVGDIVFYSPRMRRAGAASSALISLGPDASPAFPALAELLITTTNFEVRTRCWVILREIGTPAVPILTTAVADKRSYTNDPLCAILILEQIHPPATGALPALRILLREADQPNRAWALSNAIIHITGEPLAAPRSESPN
jgi:hypothetical protein